MPSSHAERHSREEDEATPATDGSGGKAYGADPRRPDASSRPAPGRASLSGTARVWRLSNVHTRRHCDCFEAGRGTQTQSSATASGGKVPQNARGGKWMSGHPPGWIQSQDSITPPRSTSNPTTTVHPRVSSGNLRLPLTDTYHGCPRKAQTVPAFPTPFPDQDVPRFSSQTYHGPAGFLTRGTRTHSGTFKGISNSVPG